MFAARFCIYAICCNIFTQYIAIYLLNICNILQYIEWLKRHQAESWCVTTHICDQGFSRGRFQVTWNSWQRAASRWERGQSQTITNCCHWFAQRRVGGVLLYFCVTVFLCYCVTYCVSTVSQMGGGVLSVALTQHESMQGGIWAGGECVNLPKTYKKCTAVHPFHKNEKRWLSHKEMKQNYT